MPGLKQCFSLALLFAVTFSACSTKPLTDPILGPDHVVDNVYHQDLVLDPSLRRVAVLPISYSERSASAASVREALEPVYASELQKAGRFELVHVSPAHLQLWTGKEQWDDFDELPPDFLKKVSARTGCDGVLFARLTQYHAYPPMVIGWRMRLANNDAETVWAVDEVFDAAETPVANSARRFERARVRNNPVMEDSRSILLSPRRFGRYTLSAVCQTLPIR